MRKFYFLLLFALGTIFAQAKVFLVDENGNEIDENAVYEVLAVAEIYDGEPWSIVAGANDLFICNDGESAEVSIEVNAPECYASISWCGPESISQSCSMMQEETEVRSGVMGAGVVDNLLLDTNFIRYDDNYNCIWGKDVYGERPVTISVTSNGETKVYKVNFVYDKRTDIAAGITTGIESSVARNQFLPYLDLAGRSTGTGNSAVGIFLSKGKKMLIKYKP